MIKRILSILKREKLNRASSEDYETFFGSSIGNRILSDLIVQFNVGGPSFVFDKTGKLDIEQSARVDAAKVIIQYMMTKAKFKPDETERPTKASRGPLDKLPSASTSL